MTDNELLLAISNMMDEKFKAELKPIKNELENVKNDIKQVRTELKGDIEQVRNELENVRTELKGDIEQVRIELKGDVEQVRNELENVRTELKGDVEQVRTELINVKLFQENTLLPRLDTISSCYTDTYDRYKNNADKMDAAFTNIELLNKVVSEHSKKLQNIS